MLSLESIWVGFRMVGCAISGGMQFSLPKAPQAGRQNRAGVRVRRVGHEGPDRLGEQGERGLLEQRAGLLGQNLVMCHFSNNKHKNK